jgi:hypothetical protein
MTAEQVKLASAANTLAGLLKVAFSIRGPTNPVPAAPKLPMASPVKTVSVAPPTTPTATNMKRSNEPIIKSAVLGAAAHAAHAQHAGGPKKAPTYKDAVNLTGLSLPQSEEYLKTVIDDPSTPEKQFGKTTPFADLVLGRRLTANARLA